MAMVVLFLRGHGFWARTMRFFGTLLERALNPIERHKLGAHYTPRAYVERLVMPAVVEQCESGGLDFYEAAA